MSSLKEKTIAGAKWSAIGQISVMASEFFVGLILARLLLPSDFGTIAVIAVFIYLSEVFINSGFIQALVRDNETTNEDYSTVFYFNFCIAIFFYLIIFFAAPWVADFYENPQIVTYLRVLGLGVIVSGLTLVQRAIITKAMDFKTLNLIATFSNIFSGLLAIGLAFSGFGVWSLIAKGLVSATLVSIILWLKSKWTPSLVFSLVSLKRFFKYGSNLLISGLIAQVYGNIFALTIGKVFSLSTLGFYNRAELFRNLISTNIEGIVTGVSYPALAKIQQDKELFINGVFKVLKTAFLVIGVLLAGLFAAADPLIRLLLGEKWLQVIPILQHLCIAGLFIPLNSIMINSISVSGRSDWYLKFQIVGFTLSFLTLGAGALWGLDIMLKMMILTAALSYVWVSFIFRILFQYPILAQLKQLKNKFFLILFLLLFLKLSGLVLGHFPIGIQLGMYALLGVAILLAYLKLTKDEEGLFLKSMVISKVIKTK